MNLYCICKISLKTGGTEPPVHEVLVKEATAVDSSCWCMLNCVHLSIWPSVCLSVCLCALPQVTTAPTSAGGAILWNLMAWGLCSSTFTPPCINSLHIPCIACWCVYRYSMAQQSLHQTRNFIHRAWQWFCTEPRVWDFRVPCSNFQHHTIYYKPQVLDVIIFVFIPRPSRTIADRTLYDNTLHCISFATYFIPVFHQSCTYS